MTAKYKFCFTILFCSLTCASVLAQEKDTAAWKTAIMNNNIFKFARNAIMRSSPDTDEPADVLRHKSEAPFLQYDGKGIRSISIREFGFEKNFVDTADQVDYFGTRLLNHLHRNTREWVIRDNLFFREKQALDAYLMADNERYLRSLEFIQDARIVVLPVRQYEDSVDIFVITKDVFSISGDIKDLNTSKIKLRASDANFLGQGQKVQLAVLWDKSRQPGLGYDMQYRKNNIAGTFINGTAGYTTINHALDDDVQSEHGWYVNFDRPLPYASAMFAGGLGASSYQSSNAYQKPDSSFYDYKYHSYDAWFGHNIGAKNFLRIKELQNRYFISARYYNLDFISEPYQFKDSFNFIFNSRQMLLGQFTFFRQGFYKTNYILDFGNTEDAPYGYNISLVAGWYKQLHLSRPYAGIDANRYLVTRHGELIQYFVRVGGFLHQSDFQDAALLFGASYYSKLFFYRRLKIRQYVNLSYTQQFNRVGMPPLSINNDFGLANFGAAEIMGRRRISLKSETSFYMNAKLFGFKFAPFLFGNAVMLTPEHASTSKSDLYYGIGGGMRTRNQNLVFGTVEFRAVYFPRTNGLTEAFKIGINANIRFRYNTSYIKAPDIVQVNADPDNKIN